jgi:putative Holliday junction resolvase
MRILGVDPGERRLGIAISDPTGTIANPLTIIRHVARKHDAKTIVDLAEQHGAQRIVVGQALDTEGMPTTQSRSAERLAEVIRSQTDLDVVLWDESGSTLTAREARITMGVKRRRRQKHLDDLAATLILQSYLDSHNFTHR